MSQFKWTADGKIIDHGEMIAHFDDDNELILDCTHIDDDEIARDAFRVLQEDGADPDQFRAFTFEKFACLAAGLTPWETTLVAKKTCAMCGQAFDRDDINANSIWGKEAGFQRAKICSGCVSQIADPVAQNWEL